MWGPINYRKERFCKLSLFSSKYNTFLRSECISHEVNKVENSTIYLHQIMCQEIYSLPPWKSVIFCLFCVTFFDPQQMENVKQVSNFFNSFKLFTDLFLASISLVMGFFNGVSINNKVKTVSQRPVNSGALFYDPICPCPC